jgi:hypothetical protein
MVISFISIWDAMGGPYNYGIVPLCIVWSIWWERNDHIFNDTELNGNSLQSIFVLSVYDWMLIIGNMHPDSLFYFIALLIFSVVIC